MDKIFKKIRQLICKLLVFAEGNLFSSDNGLNSLEREEKIIISMTSYPQRFSTIGEPLNSLLRQSVKPDKIIVWLGSDSSREDLTDEMLEFEKKGIEFRFDQNKNLKPHKKYFYALQEFPQDLVITVDDDIIYPRNTIKSLITAHKKYPNNICARRVHKIALDNNHQIAPYLKWDYEYRGEVRPSKSLFATNGAGTIFPHGCLPKEAFNAADIERYCLNADDVWLWYWEQKQGISTVWVPCFMIHPPVVKELKTAGGLAEKNVELAGNDYYIKELFEHYGKISIDD